MPDLRASGDRRRLRPARALRGAGDLPRARPRKTHGLGHLGPGIPPQRLRLRLPAQVRHPRRQLADVRPHIHARRLHRPAQHVQQRAAVQLRRGQVCVHVAAHAAQRSTQVRRACSIPTQPPPAPPTGPSPADSWRTTRGGPTERRCRARRGARRHAHRRRGRARLGPGGLVVARPDRGTAPAIEPLVSRAAVSAPATNSVQMCSPIAHPANRREAVDHRRQVHMQRIPALPDAPVGRGWQALVGRVLGRSAQHSRHPARSAPTTVRAVHDHPPSRSEGGLPWPIVRRDVQDFCERYGLQLPILQAPMAGACPPELAVAVTRAGGMGAAGVVLDHPDQITEWTRRFRAASAGALQLNIWIPDQPGDDPAPVDAAAAFLHRIGTPARTGTPGPDFAQQTAQSMWKKSTASMLVAWVRRNCRQPVSACRNGAGGMRWRLRIRRIVEAPTRWPSVSNSPSIRM